MEYMEIKSTCQRGGSVRGRRQESFDVAMLRAMAGDLTFARG
jgi:hypothetical protein